MPAIDKGNLDGDTSDNRNVNYKKDMNPMQPVTSDQNVDDNKLKFNDDVENQKDKENQKKGLFSSLKGFFKRWHHFFVSYSFIMKSISLNLIISFMIE